MKKEVRTIIYDEDLSLESYRLEGIVQPFPNHFHEYYVFGLIEAGKRFMSCKNTDYKLTRGNIVIFHPHDNHSCAQCGEELLDYRGINVPQKTMLSLMEEITGERKLPGFQKNVIENEEAANYLRALHDMIMNGSKEFEKEETLILLLTLLMQEYGQPFENSVMECIEEIEKACQFMKLHYHSRICLDQISHEAGLSKSTLLRAFTKSKGVTPYRYLETIRINEAKKLLEQGCSPIEAALQTGFSDQSHFTNYFNQFIGISPGMYRSIFINKQKKESEDE